MTEENIVENLDVELNDCPFCLAGQNELDIYEKGLGFSGKIKRYQVICSNCFARGPQASSPEKAVEEWNKGAKNER